LRPRGIVGRAHVRAGVLLLRHRRVVTGVCVSEQPRHVPEGCPSMTSIMSDVIAGRIELLDPLARGATGSLWRAIDRRYGAICAAKVMRQRDGADVLRFVREQTVGTAQGLGAHPHLLPPYTWVAED